MNSTAPKLSILCPVYNSAKYARETLETILAQSYADWELVAMDGGSKDGTKEIFAEYAKRDPRIRFYSESDEGAWHATFKALSRARGEYVCFMYVSDGYANPEWFSSAMRALSEDRTLSLVWGVPYDMTEDGKLLGPHFAYAHFLTSKRQGHRWRSLRAIWDRLNWRNLRKVLAGGGGYQISAAASILRGSRPLEKEEWFAYWLKTGLAFPDANMIARKNVFEACAPRHELGSREVDAFADFYFNFNARGYLARCLPVAANYGRIHSAQVTEKHQAEIQKMRSEYLLQIDNFKKRLARQKEMVFVDPQGVPVFSRPLRGGEICLPSARELE